LLQHNEVVQKETTTPINDAPSNVIVAEQKPAISETTTPFIACPQIDQTNQSSVPMTDQRKMTCHRVLEWDAAAMQYARLSYEGHATLTWMDNADTNDIPNKTKGRMSDIRLTDLFGLSGVI
jgi:hypothetical protein